MAEPAAPEIDNELQHLLDQELAQLPDKYRAVVIMCELEGMLLRDAAQQLGVPEGTIASRLARGRAMLAKRLTRHGISVTGVSLGALFAQHAASACVPTAVLSTTIQATILTAAGQAGIGTIVSANAVALAEGVVKSMFLSKLGKLALVCFLALVRRRRWRHCLFQRRQRTDAERQSR